MAEAAFTIENLSPGDLVPNPHNFRRHPENQRRALASSLEEHGWVDAPLFNRTTGHLIDGHARVEQALADGEERIPVKVVDLSLAKEKRLLRSFDAITSMALTDDAALDALIAEIDDASLEQLLGEIAEPVSGLLPEADPDAIPEQVEMRCRPGDLWRLGEHRLLCGDSTKREDVERLMAGKRASLMMTDPPYGVGYDGNRAPNIGQRKDWTAQYFDWPATGEPERAFLELAMEVLAPHAPVYQWCADRRLGLLLPMWSGIGLHVHEFVYWRKPAILSFAHFMADIEPCIYGWPEGSPPELIPPRDTKQTWEVGRERFSGKTTVHPCQKPIALFEGPIEWQTRPSEICYEPFAGSGTQIIAAEQLGRACYAIEISPEFCDVILARWESATGRTAERLQ